MLKDFMLLLEEKKQQTVKDKDQTSSYGLQETKEAEEEKVEQEQPEQKKTYSEDMEQLSEDAITPEVRDHLSKVYRLMTVGLGLTGVGSLLGMVIPGLSMIGLIGSLAAIVGIIFVNRENITLRKNLFYAIGLFEGMFIAPLLAVSAPGVILAAAVGTAAIFGGFTLAALKSKRSTTLMLAGPLLGGLFLVFAAGLLHLLLPLFGVTNPAILAALYNINIYVGLGLFSLFITYDTKRMIENAKEGVADVVSDALNMFLNIINIFIRLLEIFRR